MILDLSPGPQVLLLLGLVTFALVVFQVLVGLRVIRFKGRTHMKVHTWGAYALLGLGAVHGAAAFMMYLG